MLHPAAMLLRLFCFVALTCPAQAALAQDSRHIAFGAGLEYTAKAHLWPDQGSPYQAFGGYSASGAVRFQPAYGERGFIATIRAGYARDDAKYPIAQGLLFGVDREYARLEFEALLPTRAEVLWWSTAIGTDWNTNTSTYLLAATTTGSQQFNAGTDLYIADRDLFAARRLLVPTISTGPALRLPAGERQALWAQFIVRQAFLDAFEDPVAVTIRAGLSSPRSVIVSQRPTYFGLALSYFF